MTPEQTRGYIDRIKNELLLITEATDIDALNASYITIHVIASLLREQCEDEAIISYINNELVPCLDTITNYHLVRIANDLARADIDNSTRKYKVGMCLQSVKGKEDAFTEERDLISSLYNTL